ncbi:SET domain-containing protein [Colletotrichum eremochloae]|nr:SET domain-containing protein [Colletotrichum eremochloae]
MGLLALSKFDILPLLAAMLVSPATALGSNQCPWHPSGPLGILEQCRVAYDPRTPSASPDWGPWTHKPVCVGPKAGKGTALCAFVKEDFRGEAGLLVVTSPEIAAADHSFVQDFDPRWLGYERQAARSDDGAPPFEVREVPGKKGLGAVANATIRAGDVVLREHPVLLHLAEVSEPVERMQALWVLEEGFIRLPIEDQRRVFDLSRSTGGHVLEDIIRTNTFGATFNNVGHFGLFPRVARINHACKPNAITRFSPRTLELEVVAYKDIRPGEELSISYSMLNMLYDDRKRTLREWGFACACALCSSPTAVAASDARLARLQAILAALEETDPAASLVAKLTDELEDVAAREGLAAQAGEFYGMVARAYARAGEVGAARRYAAVAVEGLERFAGHDDDRTARARDLLGELGRQVGDGRWHE